MEGGHDDVARNHSMELHPRAWNRFLGQGRKKGGPCVPGKANACSGIPGDYGTQLLHCCQKRCCDLLNDNANCGTCNKRCGYWQLCCRGTCTNVASDDLNCGQCGEVCRNNDRCEYGMCGYA
ncbi:hypothetical protein BHE74_00039253 [Ensete ventricosum]|nr:hypothetical protein BHE74_00039253 [Ensete ventricosum]